MFLLSDSAFVLIFDPFVSGDADADSVARFSDLAQILVLFVGSERFFFAVAISAIAAIFQYFAVARENFEI